MRRTCRRPRSSPSPSACRRRFPPKLRPTKTKPRKFARRMPTRRPHRSIQRRLTAKVTERAHREPDAPPPRLEAAPAMTESGTERARAASPLGRQARRSDPDRARCTALERRVAASSGNGSAPQGSGLAGAFAFGAGRLRRHRQGARRDMGNGARPPESRPAGTPKPDREGRAGRERRRRDHRRAAPRHIRSGSSGRAGAIRGGVFWRLDRRPRGDHQPFAGRGDRASRRHGDRRQQDAADAPRPSRYRGVRGPRRPRQAVRRG